MGNAPVKIGIRLDQSTVEAGQVLQGRVYLSVKSRQESVQGIHLLLQGHERTTVVSYEHKGHRDHEKRHEDSGTFVLANYDVPLVFFDNGIIKPGQYEYPFEWPIPANLPSSMTCHHEESSCQVEYNLTAYLHTTNNHHHSTAGTDDLSCTVNVTVMAQSEPDHKGPHPMDLEEYSIKSCCATQGTMIMGWDADTTILTPRGTINIGIVGKNDSVVSVKYLKSSLLETIVWSAGGRTHTTKRALASSKSLPHGIWTALQNHPNWWDRRRIQAENADPHLLSQLMNQRCELQLSVPGDARDTYEGRMIHVRHSLVITVETPGCCNTSPEDCILVKIQRHKPTTSRTVPPQPPQEIFLDQVMAVTIDEGTFNTVPPMAEAQVLPEDWAPEESHVVVIPVDNVFLPQQTSGPSAPPETLRRDYYTTQPATNLAELISLLEASDNPSLLLEQELKNPILVSEIQSMSPHELVETLKQASRQNPQDFPRNARLLASCTNFYCRHVLACLWSLPQSVRFQVLREVAPLATDLEKQRALVEQELDDTELQQFRAALT
jgi:hypothetical protein